MNDHQNTFELSKPLVYVDTEWTDTHPEFRRIVSIAITRFNPDGSRQNAYWVVNPKRVISEQATAVHGIRNEDVKDKPMFKDIAKEVHELLKDADIAGYSVNNDIEIIEKEMARAGRSWAASIKGGRRIIDAYRLWQVREPRSLRDAYRKFVGPIPEDTKAHDARHDVEITIAVLNAMRDGKTVAELHQEAHPDMVDPAGKFRREDGQIVYNFGPYRGMPVKQHPQYLRWMATKSFAPSTMQVAFGLIPMHDRNDWVNDDWDEDDDLD